MSISLRPDSLDYLTNDDGNYWCQSSSPISGTNPDTGTPNAVNDSCP
jgi:hypothetical protein